nr:hypothetical protein [uncultured Draconibacterium sp.]
MRKLIYLLTLVLIITSCSDDDNETPKTTYQIVNNMEADSNPAIEYLDGTLWEVTVFCLDETGDVVREDNLDPVHSGGDMSDKQDVADYITKVVVSFRFLPRESSIYDMESNNRRYTVTRYVMVEGENNMIEIDGETNIQTTLSLKSADTKLLQDAFCIEL